MRLSVSFLYVIALAVFSNRVAGAGLRYRSVAASSADEPVEAEYATIPIDHNDSLVGNYQNRYWVNDKYYTPGGPIFIYDTGESPVEKQVNGTFFNSTAWFEPMLQGFHGMGILWEHRYYGESLPFPIKSDPAPEYMKYLTTKQALADIPHFAKTFSRDKFHDTDLTPKGSPWVMVGGSYAGIRSALTRDKYPDTIYAAYASSAPVQARVNMTIYHEQVYRGILGNKLPNCPMLLQSAMRYIDHQLSSDETAALIKQNFFGPGAERNTNGDFAKALYNIIGNFQSYGIFGGEGSILNLCLELDLDLDSSNKIVDIDEAGSPQGSQTIAERLANWSPLIELTNNFAETNCKGLDKTKPVSCELGKPQTDPDSISWIWQYCTEWGFFQANNIGLHALLSKYLTLEHEQVVCNRNFPTAIKTGAFPSQPQADAINAEFGGWNIRPSNVYWTEGEFDPWRPLSVLSNEEFAPQGVKVSSEIPKCGVQTGQDTVFGHLLPHREHCFDLHAAADDAEAEPSRKIFKDALRGWLPCYKSQGG